VIKFQVEKWADSVVEMREIWPEHWASLALNQDEIKLSCDEEKYEQGEAAGNLIIITARAEGVLVGYYYGMLLNHLHYKDAGLMCYTDVYYLKPEHRKGGAGAKFMLAIQQILKFRGVVKLYMSTKVHQDNGALFERLGMKLSDRVFTKML
jgi:L-amino acid N-acyltransferase YncA